MKVYEVEKWVPRSFVDGAIHFQVKEVSFIQEFKRYGVKRTIRLIRDGAISFSKLRAAVVMEIAYLDDGQKYELTPFEGSQKTRYVRQRGCRITVGSAVEPDSLAGEDLAMAHLSEVGLWPSSNEKKPEDLARSIIGSINSQKCSLIAYESTARGVGNYFHSEWLRANLPDSDKNKSVYVRQFLSHGLRANCIRRIFATMSVLSKKRGCKDTEN
jgi:hypothetical protein